MSIGPAPNISGGLSTLMSCCLAGQDGGNGTIVVAPSGRMSPPCACILSSPGGGGGGGGDPVCCDGKPICGGNGGNGGGGGQCGSGNGGGGNGGTNSGPPPGDPIACILDIGVWNPCTCQWVWCPGGPGDPPSGAGSPIPPPNAYAIIASSPTNPCGTTPNAVPVGAPTPAAAPASGPGVGVLLEESSPNSGNISGFPLYCVETGVTLTSECTAVVFYSTAAELLHINVGTNTGQNCSDSSIHSYNGSNVAETSRTIPPIVDVFMTRV